MRKYVLYRQAAGETPALPEAAHSLNVNALKGQPAHSPGQHPGSHGFIPPFYRPERAKALHECEVLRLCPYRASVDTVMPITQGVATLCPGLWAVALSGRAFNLQGVDSTRLRPKILQPVMVEILPDSYKNIIG